jgi:hypothetical protein
MRSFSENQSMEAELINIYKHTFVSKQRDDYVDGNLSFEDIDYYLIDADVNSLYPAAMKNEFPVDIPTRLKPNTPSVNYFNDLISDQSKCPKVGICRIEYITNKNLIDAILPRREEGRLKWDLQDSVGVYNSVDINNDLDLGYKIKIIEGYYWEETAHVFDKLHQLSLSIQKGF